MYIKNQQNVYFEQNHHKCRPAFHNISIYIVEGGRRVFEVKISVFRQYFLVKTPEHFVSCLDKCIGQSHSEYGPKNLGIWPISKIWKRSVKTPEHSVSYILISEPILREYLPTSGNLVDFWDFKIKRVANIFYPVY